jgi:hypothetical protein
MERRESLRNLSLPVIDPFLFYASPVLESRRLLVSPVLRRL